MAIQESRIDPEGTIRSEADGTVTLKTSPASSDRPSYPDDRTPEEIRRDIERTRAEMDTTLDALSERMTPRHLLDELFEFWHGDEGRTRGARRTFRETGTRLADSVKEHPVPAALIGAGLAWLLLEDKKPRYRRNPEPPMYGGSYVDARTGEPYDESYGEQWRGGRPLQQDNSSETGFVEKAKDKLSEAAHSVRESMGDARESTRETLSEMGERGSHATDRLYGTTRRTFEQWLDEAPLGVGVAALAAGLAAGLLLPETRRENELFGEASDHLKDQVKAAGGEVIERGGEAISEAADTTTQEIKRQTDKI